MKHRGYGNFVAIERGGGGDVSGGAWSMIRVSITVQRKDGDRGAARIDDPVLGNADFGIVRALLGVVALRIVGTDDLGNEVGTEPVSILSPRIGGVQKEHQVGLAESPVGNSQPQRRDKRDAPLRSHKLVEKAEQGHQDGLVRVGGHGQFLDAAICELD